MQNGHGQNWKQILEIIINVSLEIPIDHWMHAFKSLYCIIQTGKAEDDKTGQSKLIWIFIDKKMHVVSGENFSINEDEDDI